MRSIAGTTENIGGVSFGIGSTFFFYLFFKSRHIPRVLSSLGLAASVIWMILFCQFDIPRTAPIIPIHLFSTDGSG